MVYVQDNYMDDRRMKITLAMGKEELLRRLFIFLYLPIFCFIISSISCLYVACFSPLIFPEIMGDLHPFPFISIFYLIFLGIPCLIVLFYGTNAVYETRPSDRALLIIILIALISLAASMLPKLLLLLIYTSALFYALESISRANPRERIHLVIAMPTLTLFSIISWLFPISSIPLFLIYTSALFYRAGGAGSRREIAILAVIITFSLLFAVFYQSWHIKSFFQSARQSHLLSSLKSWGLFLMLIFFASMRMNRNLFMRTSSIAILISPIVFYVSEIFFLSFIPIISLIVILAVPLHRMRGELEAAKRCIIYAFLMWISCLLRFAWE
ncbi:MAG: hypothetical protein ACP5JF_05180 [Candidatus Methanodesulfokora sp.]